MALTKVTYTDDVTVIGAQNLNAIQDEIISLETVSLVAVNSDLDTIQTPGRYRLWGAYTNAPKTGNLYGVLTVDGVSGALIQTYQSATSTDSYFRGYTNSQWYPWKQFMLNSGGTINGTIYIDRKDGTTSATGTSTLWLGNNTPTGTAGNSKGQVVLYGNGANYINIQASNATGNRTVELPDANGTLALTSDIAVENTNITASDCVNIQTPSDINASVCKSGSTCVLRLISGVKPSSTGSGWVKLFNLPYEPAYRFNFIVMNDTDGTTTEARVDNTGFYVYSPVAGKSYWGEGIYIRA